MGTKFNPFTGQIDFTGSGGGGGGGGDVYELAFTIASWGSAVSGYYYITVTQGTHDKGLSPGVQIFEEDGSDYVLVNVDEIKVMANGDVAIRVPETPDLRFDGRLIII